MEAPLVQLLEAQYQLLDRMEIRWRYCSRAPLFIAEEFHRQYGPYAREWDVWLENADRMQFELELMMQNLAGTADALYDELDKIVANATYEPTNDAGLALAQADLPRLIAHLAVLDMEIAQHQHIKSQILFAEMLDASE